MTCVYRKPLYMDCECIFLTATTPAKVSVFTFSNYHTFTFHCAGIFICIKLHVLKKNDAATRLGYTEHPAESAEASG
jgi:hypothetical protein